ERRRRHAALHSTGERARDLRRFVGGRPRGAGCLRGLLGIGSAEPGEVGTPSPAGVAARWSDRGGWRRHGGRAPPTRGLPPAVPRGGLGAGRRGPGAAWGARPARRPPSGRGLPAAPTPRGVPPAVSSVAPPIPTASPVPVLPPARSEPALAPAVAPAPPRS